MTKGEGLELRPLCLIDVSEESLNVVGIEIEKVKARKVLL